jgi:hypothetical protein
MPSVVFSYAALSLESPDVTARPVSLQLLGRPYSRGDDKVALRRSQTGRFLLE